MNPNVKSFTAIFFFIWGVVGAVLCVVNLTAEPAATSKALLFGCVGVIGFFAGSLMIRKPRY